MKDFPWHACGKRLSGKHKIGKFKNPIVILFMLSSILWVSPKAHSAQNQSLIEGNTAFALELYSQVKSTPGNLFFSPYSISTCLAMAYAGARGDTEKQMAQVFHFGADQKKTHASFA